LLGPERRQHLPPEPPYHFEFTGLGNRNNVNIRVLDGSVTRMDMDSPDNRVPGVWYTVVPETGSVFTLTAGRDDAVEFEAIFDRANRSDPRCFVSTPRI
jgi:hypothetical protein